MPVYTSRSAAASAAIRSNTNLIIYTYLIIYTQRVDGFSSTRGQQQLSTSGEIASPSTDVMGRRKKVTTPEGRTRLQQRTGRAARASIGRCVYAKRAKVTPRTLQNNTSTRIDAHSVDQYNNDYSDL